jgi:phosphohistidine phosphatase
LPVSLRRVVLLRHAEAVTAEEAGSDFARTLTVRGQEQARRAGTLLRDRGLRPDAIVASPAARALRTATLAAAVAEFHGTIATDASLYDASADAILASIARHAHANVLWVVAHNPGLEDTGAQLAGLAHWSLGKGCYGAFETLGWPPRDGHARLADARCP